MSASFTLFGKTIEQWTFSGEEQVAFLDQWLKADRYKLTTKEFCQSLVENGTDALKQIGQAGLDAPGQGQRFVDVLEGWFPGVVLSSIRAAESAGQRHIGLQTAIEQLRGGENIVAKLVKMLAFPYALTVGAGFYGVYIADKMLSAIDNQARHWAHGAQFLCRLWHRHGGGVCLAAPGTGRCTAQLERQ
ncbi:hypothetical protein QYZ46_26190 [Vibrio parahaemolyticus]|nr:hypothetical protein [Vibrio parahaemolyticus]